MLKDRQPFAGPHLAFIQLGMVERNRDLIGDYSAELALATNVPALVDRVTTRLTYGAVGSARRTEIIDAVASIAIPGSGSTQSQIDAAKRTRVNTAILLTVAAPEFVVLK